MAEMARWPLVALAVLALAGCGSSKSSAPTTTDAATTTAVTTDPAATTDPAVVTDPGAPKTVKPRGSVQVKITSDTHTPKVETPWHYKVHVSYKGKPVPATVSVVVLYHSVPALNLGTHPAPHGVYSGTVRWPAATRAKLVVVNAQARSNGRDGKDQFPVAGQ